MFYSPSTSGFYSTKIHTSMPADVVEITDLRHTQLLSDQSAGKTIQAGIGGIPEAVAPTLAEIEAELPALVWP